MAIYKNFTAIIQFFRDAYTSIVDFFKRLGDYMSPIWDVFKFLVNPFSGMYSLMNIKDDGVDWASKVSEKIKETEEGMGLTETELANQLDVEMEEEEKPNQGGNPMMNFLDSFWQRMIFPAGFLMSGAKAGTLEGNPIREDRSFARGMVKVHEGLELKAYKDKKGYLTVGYGHKIDADSPSDIRNLKEGDSITSQRAEELFAQDFSHHLLGAQQLPGFFKGSKKQQAALIDLTFNMGPNFLNNFPMMRRALEEGDFIEAARQFLIDEFKSVVSSDGTYINERHVKILVDVMTQHGMICSVSRYGMKKDKSGPLAKASFEQSLDNYIKAGIYCEKEKLVGVSASIMCGKKTKIVTGMCDLLQDFTNLPTLI